jgi:hypothetical protein
MSRLLAWLERLAREHLDPLADLTPGREREAVSRDIANSRELLAALERQNAALVAELRSQAAEEAAAAERLDEWDRRKRQ